MGEKLTKVLLLALCFLVPQTLLHAKEATTDTDSIDCTPQTFNKTGNTKLDSLAELNIEFNLEGCKLFLGLLQEQGDLNTKIDEWLRRVYSANGKQLMDILNYAGKPNKLESIFEKAYQDSRKIPQGEKKKLLKLAESEDLDNEDYRLLLFNPTDEKLSLPIDSRVCKSISGKEQNCINTFKDIAGVVNLYRQGYNNILLDDNLRKLDAMSIRWTRFIEEARQQTIFDAWLTTALTSKFKENHLVGPPDVQLFTLHPGIVYEHLGNAPSGEKDQIALSMEWFGFNFWDLTVPFGMSIMSIYSDRTSESGADFGLMLYLDNSYSIGWVDRDTGDGIFFSMDLLKALTDKKEQLNKYKKQF